MSSPSVAPKNSHTHESLTRRICAFACLWLLLALIPIAVRETGGFLIQTTYGWERSLFEIFTAFASMAVIGVAYFFGRKRAIPDDEDRAPVAVWVIVALYHLLLIHEYSFRTWDYDCYQNAAQAIQRHRNPYGAGYLYPPLWALLLEQAYQFVAAGLSGLIAVLPPKTGTETILDPNRIDVTVWNLVFYFFRVSQFLAVSIAYWLFLQIGRNLRLTSSFSSLLAGLLLIVNNPLLRTLHHNQINVWVLDLFLIGTCLLVRFPATSGLFFAMGGVLKVYPLAVLAPLAVARRWRAVCGIGLSLVTLLILQTKLGSDWTLWREYLTYASSYSASTGYRASGIQGFVENALNLMFYGRCGVRIPESWAIHAGHLAVAAATVAVGVRALRRERAAPSPSGRETDSQLAVLNTARYYGHAFDAMAWMLIVSPLVWAHHFVMALPLLFLAVAARGDDCPWRVCGAGILIFALPTIEIFPLAYHRLAGLLWLLALTSPEIVVPRLTESPPRMGASAWPWRCRP